MPSTRRRLLLLPRASPSPWPWSQRVAQKANDLSIACGACVRCARGWADCSRGDLRRLARIRADLDLRESGLDRDQAARRTCPPISASCSPSTRARSWAWRRAGRSGAASRRSRSCTRPPASATLSARWPPRASIAPRSWSSSASRTAGTSPREPFLAGKLRGLAGEYPVWIDEPVRPQDVPGAIARAVHEAVTGCGPALVIVPMDDWLADAGAAGERAAPRRVVRARAADAEAIAELAALIAGARARRSWSVPARTTPRPGQSLVALAERLTCPVWQESFSSRAGFPQDHRALRRPSAGRPRPPARDTRAARRRGRDRLAGLPPVPVRRRAVRERGDDRGDGEPRSRRGAPERGRPRVAGEARAGVRRAGTRPARAQRRASCAPRATCFPGCSGRRRAAARGPRLRGDGRAHSSRCDRDRGVAFEPSRVARAPACARVARLAQPGHGRARVRPARRDRAAHGAADAPRRGDRRRRLVALLHPGAVECSAVRRRGALRDPCQRRLRDHGPACRAGRRLGPVAGLLGRHRGPRARVRVPGAHRRRAR